MIADGSGGAQAAILSQFVTSGNVELTAVNQDGEAVGLAFDAAEPPSQQACWIRGQSFGAFAQPSSTPHRLVPMAVGVGLVSVGMAFDESDATSEARAVIMRPERTVFLDDVASGQFVIASSISRCGSILAARIRNDGVLQLCRLADTAVDPTGDDLINTEDVAPWIERFGIGDEALDVNLDGALDGNDFIEFLSRVDDRVAPQEDWNNRALELVMAVERFVPIDAWPATVQRACYARLRALMSVEVVEPAAIHTPECRVHVITEHPNCANQWDASCEDATAVFYSQGNQARLGPWLTVNCHAAICAVQPSCCDYIWDSSCEVLATLNCTLAPGFGCNWSGQPYPYDWRYLGYCGASGGATFPVACFNECCFEHDLCYGVCGMRPGETNLRLGCDETLLECALSKCLTGAAGYNPPLSACPAPLENCAAAA